ncbi:hypothetical protein Acor_69360 [Acrocarpospora corrugata]|uniref:Uncharacterized protein n=1 Tax=Acrocarpospora corrugata TaxID=35763 RepID=A0A5M3WEU0_9ACTN|nr:hypothetical protein Acor_69360 [Acrocarpospora corrugata]
MPVLPAVAADTDRAAAGALADSGASSAEARSPSVALLDAEQAATRPAASMLTT